MLFARRTPSPPEEYEPPRHHGVLARGAKTVLRELEREDIDRWIAWPRHQDPMFENYNPPVLNERQREMYFRQYRDATISRQYSVDDLEDRFVGRVSIRDIDWRLGAAVLGISVHPGRLGEGLGTDALWAFLAYYFEGLEMSTLFLDVAAFNQRAHRVYEKCGFRRCGEHWGEPQTDYAGVFRKPEYESIRQLFKWDHGLVRPLLVDMVLRRDDWQRRRSQSPAVCAAAR
jgi:diamine N-acetyltransferase